jgi:hypothetical protein
MGEKIYLAMFLARPCRVQDEIVVHMPRPAYVQFEG